MGNKKSRRDRGDKGRSTLKCEICDQQHIRAVFNCQYENCRSKPKLCENSGFKSEEIAGHFFCKECHTNEHHRLKKKDQERLPSFSFISRVDTA